MNTLPIGKMTVGDMPRVVGTIVQPESLAAFGKTDIETCDIAEVRLDRVGADCSEWLRGCKHIEGVGVPVLLTLRLSSEGGSWKKSDKERMPVFQGALESLSAVDIEISSVLKEDVCQFAREKEKTVIVSYHNFEKTPSASELQDIVGQVRGIPGTIPKIATMVHSQSDVETLEQLLKQTMDGPICVIGMGPLGTKTRLAFACLGSCLTYGYLDDPSAPGQLPSSYLTEQLRMLSGDYNEDVIIRKELFEFV